MRRSQFYVLVDREPIEVDSMTWARQAEQRTVPDRDPWRVGETHWEDGARLSTVFLGLDHQFFPDGPPLLFETMLFPADSHDEEWMLRCSTWEQALTNHRIGMLEAIKTHGQPVTSLLIGVL